MFIRLQCKSSRIRVLCLLVSNPLNQCNTDLLCIKVMTPPAKILTDSAVYWARHDRVLNPLNVTAPVQIPSLHES